MRCPRALTAILTAVLATSCTTQPLQTEEVVALMEAHQVPGMSVAVIDDYEVAWSEAFGVAGATTSRAVTTDTLFQTASIGKSVTAMTTLHQVRRGVLDLDEDVSAYLTSWAIPDNEYTDENPVTVRGLLSHTAGVNGPGFVGYVPDLPLPTLRQTLDGARPANNDPIRVTNAPGTYRYSSGGYQILEQVLNDATGSEFTELVTETVFEPLGMTTSFYDPLPESNWSRVAVGHRSNGQPVVGGWHSYSEHAAGPFWTTPSDFALFGNEVMLAYTGQSEVVISQDLAVEMLTPVDSGYGLGLAITDDGGDRLHATHLGGSEGYKTLLVLYPERGQGAVIMTNSDNGVELAWDVVDLLSLHFKWVSGVILSPTQTVFTVLAGLTLLGAGALFWRRRRSIRH